jgi:quinol-cytochrome oxidoreductase complex cytochrome b subunit
MSQQIYFEKEISEALAKTKASAKYPDYPNIGVFWFLLSLALSAFLIIKIRS